MCVHPRCGLPAEYQLKETEWGDQCFLCERHTQQYQKAKGGSAVSILTGEEVEFNEESN